MFAKLTQNQYANVWIKRFTLEFSHILTMIATTEYLLANFYKWTFFYSADWVGNVKITVRPQMSLVQNSKYSCIFLYLTVFTSLSLSFSCYAMKGLKLQRWILTRWMLANSFLVDRCCRLKKFQRRQIA